MLCTVTVHPNLLDHKFTALSEVDLCAAQHAENASRCPCTVTGLALAMHGGCFTSRLTLLPSCRWSHEGQQAARLAMSRMSEQELWLERGLQSLSGAALWARHGDLCAFAWLHRPAVGPIHIASLLNITTQYRPVQFDRHPCRHLDSCVHKQGSITTCWKLLQTRRPQTSECAAI